MCLSLGVGPPPLPSHPSAEGHHLLPQSSFSGVERHFNFRATASEQMAPILKGIPSPLNFLVLLSQASAAKSLFRPPVDMMSPSCILSPAMAAGVGVITGRAPAFLTTLAMCCHCHLIRAWSEGGGIQWNRDQPRRLWWL